MSPAIDRIALTILKSSSRTSAPEGAGLAVVATGLRLRGAGGRMTARLVRGGIDQFRGVASVLVGGGKSPLRGLEVESAELYSDKVVLKFRGIDTANAAEELAGADILMPCKGLVDLPEGSYYIFELVGMRVRTRDGRDLGTVREVLETGGTPILTVRPDRDDAGGGELLLPAARSICTVIDRVAGIITIDPPEGLLELYGL
jgi:16S rRNA processing protein RimM